MTNCDSKHDCEWRCLTCGHRLGGLGNAGTCPGCGSDFDIENFEAVFDRPHRGWQQLLVAPSIAAVGSFIGVINPMPLDLLLIVVGLIVAIPFSVRSATALAMWHYRIRIVAWESGTAIPVFRTFVLRRATLLIVVQLVVCELILGAMLIILR